MTYWHQLKIILYISFLALFFIRLSHCIEFTRGFTDDDDDDYSRPAGFDSNERLGDAPGELRRECPFRWQGWGDNCYVFETIGKQWSQAEKACAVAAEGAHLASVTTKEELDFIFALIGARGTHWLHKEHGAYHSFNSASDFVWVGLAYMCPAASPESSRWTDGSRQNSSIPIGEYRPSTSLYGSHSSIYGSGYSSFSSSSSSSATSRGQPRCIGYHLWSTGGQLMKNYCLDYAPYICKVAKDLNKTVDEDDALPKEEGSDDDKDKCDGYDWCPYNGSCYKILNREVSWYEARTSCQSEGADLVSIHSGSEIDYLNNNLTSDWLAGTSFWTGLNKLESVDDRFQWSDNTPIDFLPSIGVEGRSSLQLPRNPSCVSLRVSQLRRLLPKSPAAGKMRDVLDGELQLSRCDTSRASVCKKSASGATPAPKAPTPAPTKGGCSNGWTLFRNRCYRSYGVQNETAAERANFRDAQQVCAKQRANLVSIQNAFDNLFVLSLLNNDDLNQSWIGLIYNEGKLKWIDETEVLYTNFDSIGMSMFNIRTTPSPLGSSSTPSYYSSRTSLSDYSYGSYSSSYLWRQQERCFVISVDKAPGTWDPVSSSGTLSTLISRPLSTSTTRVGTGRRRRSVYWPYDWRRSLNLAGESCEQLKLPFICEKSKSANETSGDREWLCDGKDNTFQHGSNCYEVVKDTPSTWDEAKKYCEKSSSTLTSILTQQEYAFLASLMKKLDNVPEVWIGLQVLGEEKSTAVHAQWVDQWPVWITKWKTSPIGDQARQCVSMSQIGSSNQEVIPYWQQDSCQKKLPFICRHRKDNAEPPKAAKPGQCEVGWLIGSTQCYKVKKEDWTTGPNAMLRCWREHNATLASFPTEEDWQMISKSQELTDAKRRFFIGLMQKIHGGFEWIDNSPLEFVNWAPQEPRFGWNPSVEVCVEMDQNGLWYDAGCYETRHFICSKPKSEGTSPFTSSPASPSSSSSPVPTSGSKPDASFTTSPPLIGPSSSTSAKVTSIPTPRSVSTGNQSDTLDSFASLRASQKSKSAGSHAGVIAGIVIGVVFVLSVIALGLIYLYRQHTQGMPLFRRRTADAMRFEILNERNDEY